MNIFATYSDPVLSAQVLDNRRLVKMVLETAQLLSTSLSVYGSELAPYKPTHKNHPCAVWARESTNNYIWLLAHFRSLSIEYTNRYGKVHKCAEHREVFATNANIIPEGEFTAHTNCTIFKDEPDVHLAYRKYLSYKWDNDKVIPKWGDSIIRPF